MKNILGVCALAILLSGCLGVAESITETELSKAYDECDDHTLSLGDDGHSLLVATGPDAEAELDGIVCVVIKLDTPEYVVNEIDTTTALMGRQTVTDGNFTYSWAYHPDNGLNMTITED